jgi:hypothetical protein
MQFLHTPQTPTDFTADFNHTVAPANELAGDGPGLRWVSGPYPLIPVKSPLLTDIYPVALFKLKRRDINMLLAEVPNIFLIMFFVPLGTTLHEVPLKCNIVPPPPTIHILFFVSAQIPKNGSEIPNPY